MSAPVGQCLQHPETPTAETCPRCGSFMCARCVTTLFSRRYCSTCAARDDVNWLEVYRRSRLGKRDGLTWAALGFSLLWGFLALVQLTNYQRPLDLVIALMLLLQAAHGIAFFARYTFTRHALPLLALVWLGIAVGFENAAFGVMTVGNLATWLAVLTDTGNKLFFQLPVPEPKLLKHWKLYGDNPLSVTAGQLTVLGLFVPPVVPFALVLAIVALTRVNPNATPPVGKRWSCIGYIFVSGALCLMWGTMLVAELSRR